MNILAKAKQISINGVQYNVGQISATDQLKLLNSFGSKLVLVKGSTEVDIDIDFLIGCLISLDETELTHIQDLLVPKIYKHGDNDSCIDISLFQGNIVNFVRLLAESVRFNLADFLLYLDSTKS